MSETELKDLLAEAVGLVSMLQDAANESAIHRTARAFLVKIKGLDL